MLRIEPMSTTHFKTKKESQQSLLSPQKNENKKEVLIATLAGLATIGATIIGLQKTSPKNYEEALKKAGIQIEDGIAILIKTKEKYTGTVQRFETRSKKETIKFVDGIITEKINHNLFGKELEGKFYKNGTLRCKVGSGIEGYSVTIYNKNGELETRGDAINFSNDKFNSAREYIKSLND